MWLYNLVILILLGAIFWLDLKTPMGLEGGVPYGAVAVFAYWVNRSVVGHGVTLLAAGLLLAPSLISGLEGGVWIPLLDRFYSVANLCLIALPFYLVRKFLMNAYASDLDELKRRALQTRAELSRSEIRYKDFAESSSDSRWEINTELKYNFLSENFFSNTGFARELMEGTRRQDFIAAENEPEQVEAHMQNLQARRPFHDFRFKTKNPVKGERFWAENGKPIFDEQGAFKGYRGSTTDITELVVAETKTQEAMQLFRSAIEHLTDGFLLVDRDHRIVICNQKMLEFNSDIADLLLPGASYLEAGRIRKERDQKPFEGSAVSEILYGRENVDDTNTDSFLRKFKDGRHVIVKILKLPDNGFVITQTDISELVRAQEEAVEVSRHYRRAFDATPVMLHYMDQDQKILQVNQCWLATMGYGINEVIGHPVSEFLTDDFKTVVGSNEFNTLLASGGVAPGISGQFFAKTGDVVDVLLTIVPDQDLLSDGIRYLVCSLNITEQLKVDRMKGEFVSVVSHELRTPLTSIVGALGLLAGGASGALPEDMRTMVELAKSNADRLVRLINDILDVESIEAGEVAFRNEMIKIDKAVFEAVESCRPYAEMNNVTFTINGSVPDGKIWADRDRFVQVMANLLSNAAKFSPAGETVEVRVSQLDDDVRIEVVDNGIGIPKEFRNVIFEKFSQADSSDTRNMNGTGLGLNIAKNIVQKMRGSIGFFENKDKGTTFYVVLPLKGDNDRVLSGQIN